ncbi:hypothetical protein ACFL5O_02820 [Myxococcota bacterium]
MFSNILQILRNGQLEDQIAGDIDSMISLARQSVMAAGEFFWGKHMSDEDRIRLCGQAEAIAETERMVRNLMLVHLPLTTSTDRAHFLGLINLLREIERLGERAKNLVEIARLGSYPLPTDERVTELRALSASMEKMLCDVPNVLCGPDIKTAQRLTEIGRENMRKAESLIESIAHSDYQACHAVVLALGVRSYARIQRQVLNVLSSVIIPLHCVDFCEERAPEEQPPSSAARRW